MSRILEQRLADQPSSKVRATTGVSREPWERMRTDVPAPTDATAEPGRGGGAGAAGDALRDAGHRFTVIPSVGGFLGADNATFMVGCDRGAVDGVLAVIERDSSPREVEVPLVLLGRLKDWRAGVGPPGGGGGLVVEGERPPPPPPAGARRRG